MGTVWCGCARLQRMLVTCVAGVVCSLQLHAAFVEAFGENKVRRVGEDFAEDNGLQLNPSGFDEGAMKQLHADRSAQREHMSETLYNAESLRFRTGPDGRVIFFAFTSAAETVLQRLLECNPVTACASCGSQCVHVPGRHSPPHTSCALPPIHSQPAPPGWGVHRRAAIRGHAVNVWPGRRRMRAGTC